MQNTCYTASLSKRSFSYLCSEVASVIRKYDGISISKLVQKLQLKKVLREEKDLSGDPLA